MKMVWIMTMNKAPRVQLTNLCQGQCQERRSPPKEHRVENQKSHSSKRYLHCNTVLKCWYHGSSYKLLWAQLELSEGDAVASWLVNSTLDKVDWVRALPGDIVLCP